VIFSYTSAVGASLVIPISEFARLGQIQFGERPPSKADVLRFSFSANCHSADSTFSLPMLLRAYVLIPWERKAKVVPVRFQTDHYGPKWFVQKDLGKIDESRGNSPMRRLLPFWHAPSMHRRSLPDCHSTVSLPSNEMRNSPQIRDSTSPSHREGRA